MPFDLKGSIEPLLKNGVGDAVVQYPYYKYVGDKLVPKLGMLGKWADVGGAFLYGLAVDLISDSVPEFQDYLRQGAASVLGRSLSIAMGDPAIKVAPSPSGQSSGVAMSNNVRNFSTLNPVPLKG